jgi:hypothetical protein
MTNEQAAEILEQHNLWRRGDDEYQMADVRLLGMAINPIFLSWYSIKCCKTQH